MGGGEPSVVHPRVEKHGCAPGFPSRLFSHTQSEAFLLSAAICKDQVSLLALPCWLNLDSSNEAEDVTAIHVLCFTKLREIQTD